MLRWGYLEMEMLKKLEASGQGVFSGAAPLQQWRRSSAQSASDVSAWTEEIEQAAKVRNLLAHGLIGVDAQPDERDPAVICRGKEGERLVVSYDALIASAQNLDLLRLRLRREPDDLLGPKASS